MRISMRIPKMSREAFTRLEEATRPATGRLARYVELSRVGGFTETDAIEVDIRVEEVPRPHPTRNVVSRGMLGKVWDLLDLFPPTENPPVDTTQIQEELTGMFAEIRALGGQIRDFYNADKETMAECLRNIDMRRHNVEKIIRK